MTPRHLYLPDDLWAALCAMAHDEGLSAASLIRTLLREALRARGSK